MLSLITKIFPFRRNVGHLFTSQRKGEKKKKEEKKPHWILQGINFTDFKRFYRRLLLRSQCSALAKVRDGNQRDKSIEKCVYCTCGRVWEEGQEKLPLFYPLSLWLFPHSFISRKILQSLYDSPTALGGEEVTVLLQHVYSEPNLQQAQRTQTRNKGRWRVTNFYTSLQTDS